jgi:hypothetical protein
MVIGLDSFKEWFRGYEANYVLIGGTACDLLLSEFGEEFRATRDIDMVLIAEALDTGFGAHFWEYVKMAAYAQCFKSTGKAIYYRFASPGATGYPAMIELFSRRIEGIALPPDAHLTPLPLGDDITSLSAILLDDVYYNFLKTGVTIADGIPTLGAAQMIPFKVKAWLDLTRRKAEGEHVNSRDIRKHKNDVIRLSALLSPDVVLTLPGTIMNDMKIFVTEIEEPARYSRVAMAYGLADADTDM